MYSRSYLFCDHGDEVKRFNSPSTWWAKVTHSFKFDEVIVVNDIGRM